MRDRISAPNPHAQVGYGDYTATSAAGRVFMVFVAYMGIIGIALPRYVYTTWVG